MEGVKFQSESLKLPTPSVCFYKESFKIKDSKSECIRMYLMRIVSEYIGIYSPPLSCPTLSLRVCISEDDFQLPIIEVQGQEWLWSTFGYSFFYTCSLIVDSSFVGFPYTSPILPFHSLHPPHGCEVWRHGMAHISLDHVSMSEGVMALLFRTIANISSKLIPATATLDSAGVTCLKSRIASIWPRGIYLYDKEVLFRTLHAVRQIYPPQRMPASMRIIPL